MTRITLIILSFFVVPSAFATELAFFNPNVFGQKTSEPITPLEAHSSEAMVPIGIHLDTNKPHYYAATIYYQGLEFLEAVSIFKVKYGDPSFSSSDPAIVAWRDEYRKYAIQLSEADSETIQAIYIQFQSTEEVIEQIKKLTK